MRQFSLFFGNRVQRRGILQALLCGAAALCVIVSVVLSAPSANAAHITIDSFDYPDAGAFFPR